MEETIELILTRALRAVEPFGADDRHAILEEAACRLHEEAVNILLTAYFREEAADD